MINRLFNGARKELGGVEGGMVRRGRGGRIGGGGAEYCNCMGNEKGCRIEECRKILKYQ